jgi:hypothetical protein
LAAGGSGVAAVESGAGPADSAGGAVGAGGAAGPAESVAGVGADGEAIGVGASATGLSSDDEDNMEPTNSASSSRTTPPPTPAQTNSSVRLSDVAALLLGVFPNGARGRALPAGAGPLPRPAADRSTPPSPRGSSSSGANAGGLGIGSTPPHAGHLTRLPANSSRAANALPHWHLTGIDIVHIILC